MPDPFTQPNLANARRTRAADPFQYARRDTPRVFAAPPSRSRKTAQEIEQEAYEDELKRMEAEDEEIQKQETAANKAALKAQNDAAEAAFRKEGRPFFTNASGQILPTQDDQTYAAEKQRKAANDQKASEYFQLSRPFRYDAQGNVVPRHTDEEWEAQKAAKGAALEAAKIDKANKEYREKVRGGIDQQQAVLGSNDDLIQRATQKLQLEADNAKAEVAKRKRFIDDAQKRLKEMDLDDPQYAKIEQITAVMQAELDDLQAKADAADEEYRRQQAAKLAFDTEQDVLKGRLRQEEAGIDELTAPTSRQPATGIAPVGSAPTPRAPATDTAGVREQALAGRMQAIAQDPTLDDAQRKAALTQLGLRRKDPAAYQTAVRLEMEEADAETLAPKLKQKMQEHEQRMADLEARTQAWTQKRDQAMNGVQVAWTRAQQRMAGPHTAGDLVTVPSPDGQQQVSMPRDVAEGYMMSLARAKQWQDANQAEGDLLEIEGQEANLDAELLNEGVTVLNAKRAAAINQQAQQVRAEKSAAMADLRAAGFETQAGQLQSLDREADARVADIEDMYPEDSPERQAALEAIQKDIAQKKQGVQKGMQAQEQAAAKLYQDWGKGFAGNWIAGKTHEQHDTQYLPGAKITEDVNNRLRDYAKKLGMSEKDLRYQLEMQRLMDWSTPATSAANRQQSGMGHELAKKLDLIGPAEPTRTLPSGDIMPNPELGASREKFDTAIEAAIGTDEAKARAKALWPQYREAWLDTARATLETQTTLPGVQSYQQWRESRLAKGEFADMTENQIAERYIGEMEKRHPLRKFMDVVTSNLMAGSHDILTAIYGTAGVLFGAADKARGDTTMRASKTLSEMAAAKAAESQRLTEAQSIEGAGGLGYGIAGQAARMAPGAVATMATGNMTGAMIAGAMQTGGMTYADAYQSRIKEGSTHEEAWAQAAPASVAAGAMTAALTRAFPGGVTALNNAANRDILTKSIQQAIRTFAASATSMGRAAVKGFVDEVPQEILDEAFSQFAQGQAEGRAPNEVVSEFLTGLPELIGAAGLMGAGGEVIAARRSGGTATAPDIAPPSPGPAVVGAAAASEPEAAPKSELTNPDMSSGAADGVEIDPRPEKWAAAEAALANFEQTTTMPPEVADKTAQKARVLVKIAQGAKPESLDNDDLHLVGLHRDEAGKITQGYMSKNGWKKGPNPNGSPQPVEVLNGEFIITQRQIERMRNKEVGLGALEDAIALPADERRAQILAKSEQVPSSKSQVPSSQADETPARPTPERGTTPQPPPDAGGAGAEAVAPPPQAQAQPGNAAAVSDPAQVLTPADDEIPMSWDQSEGSLDMVPEAQQATVHPILAQAGFDEPALERAGLIATQLQESGLSADEAAVAAGSVVKRMGVVGADYTAQMVEDGFAEAMKATGFQRRPRNPTMWERKPSAERPATMTKVEVVGKAPAKPSALLSPVFKGLDAKHKAHEANLRKAGGDTVTVKTEADAEKLLGRKLSRKGRKAFTARINGKPTVVFIADNIANSPIQDSHGHMVDHELNHAAVMLAIDANPELMAAAESEAEKILNGESFYPGFNKLDPTGKAFEAMAALAAGDWKPGQGSKIKSLLDAIIDKLAAVFGVSRGDITQKQVVDAIRSLAESAEAILNGPSSQANVSSQGAKVEQTGKAPAKRSKPLIEREDWQQAKGRVLAKFQAQIKAKRDAAMGRLSAGAKHPAQIKANEELREVIARMNLLEELIDTRYAGAFDDVILKDMGVGGGLYAQTIATDAQGRATAVALVIDLDTFMEVGSRTAVGIERTLNEELSHRVDMMVSSPAEAVALAQAIHAARPGVFAAAWKQYFAKGIEDGRVPAKPPAQLSDEQAFELYFEATRMIHQGAFTTEKSELPNVGLLRKIYLYLNRWIRQMRREIGKLPQELRDTWQSRIDIAEIMLGKLQKAATAAEKAALDDVEPPESAVRKPKKAPAPNDPDVDAELEAAWEAEQKARRKDRPLIGTQGDIGQMDMLGGGDLLSMPVAKPSTSTTLPNAPATSGSVEPDRPRNDAGKPSRTRGLQSAGGQAGADAGELGQGGEAGQDTAVGRDPAARGDAADAGSESAQPVQGEPSRVPAGTAGSEQPGGSRGIDEQRAAVESGAELDLPGLAPARPRTDEVAAERESTPRERQLEQVKATTTPQEWDRLKIADPESIAKSVPMLLPQQQEDVLKAERRFFKQEPTAEDPRKGILFTNGTGTGKTFTGLGIIKRFEMMGKDRILIVVPSQQKVADWQAEGQRVMVKATPLKDTNDIGEGVVVTTYANMRDNWRLQAEPWDLVVYDESHNLSSNAQGTEGANIAAHELVTAKPGWNAMKKWIMAEIGPPPPREDQQATARYENLAEQAWKRIQYRRDVAPETRAVFLSATPFAYHKNLKYADGFLYRSPETKNQGYNIPQGFDKYLVENFGYSMRTNRLTSPAPEVDVGMMEREWAERQFKQGSMTGRMIDVPYDYSREFVLLDSKTGQQLDEGFSALSGWGEGTTREQRERFRPLTEAFRAYWHGSSSGYTRRMQFLESIKVADALDRMNQHLDMGRKIVLFHSYNNAEPVHPFQLGYLNLDAEGRQLAQEWMKDHPALVQMNFKRLENPRALVANAFGERVRFFNGEEKGKDRAAAIKAFNDDNSGVDIIMVQMDAGKEGISLHDVTGTGKQRVLMNAALPVKPTDAIQTEGRIYRIGVMSNAIQEYLVLHTQMERSAFGSKISTRTGTVENMALGKMARTLTDSFKSGYLNAHGEAPSAEQGLGGKKQDAAELLGSDMDRAKSYYFGRIKKTSRNKAAEGVDYFATPEPVGLTMVRFLEAKAGMDLLEPSAGHGAIGRFFPDFTANKFVEPSRTLADELRIKVASGKVELMPFEDLHVGANKFDGVAMNPPFGTAGKLAMEHVAKAAQHLRQGGRLVAIIPEGPAMEKRFEKWLENEGRDMHLRASYGLPTVTFERAGTSVKTRIVVIDKADLWTIREDNGIFAAYDSFGEKRSTLKGSAKAVREMLPYLSDFIGLTSETRIENRSPRELSADSINELFDKLEALEPPSRITKNVATGEVSAESVEDDATDSGPNISIAEAMQNIARQNQSAAAAFLSGGRGAILPVSTPANTPSVPITPAPVPEASKPLYEAAQTLHAKRGTMTYVAKFTRRIGDSDYAAEKNRAKQGGGYYSAFKGNGAIPGFQFESAEKRDAFVAGYRPNQTLSSAAKRSAAPAKATPFYSKLSRVIAEKMPNRADAATIQGLITNPQTGIKAEELKWSGVIPWVEAQTGPITKQAVLDYLAADGAVRLEEARMDDRTTAQIREQMLSGEISQEEATQLLGDRRGERETTKTKFAQYQLPGGENYREVVLAMPKVGSLKVYDTANGKTIKDGFQTFSEAQKYIRENALTGVNIEPIPAENYTSSHFPDVPNYVAHARLNDRTDAEGRAGTFIEEIQSDRHQAGREKGYQNDEARMTNDEPQSQGYKVEAVGSGFQLISPSNRVLGGGLFESESKAWDYAKQFIRDLASNQAEAANAGKIPDAPFRSTWPLQMFKRALADAVAAGKSWIGWTTGETQAERYKLSKQVERIRWEQKQPGKMNGVPQPLTKVITIDLKQEDDLQIAVNAEGTVIAVLSTRMPELKGKPLADVIGKEMAKRILETDTGDLAGDGLNIGGEGMKGFYDTILPKEIGKYVKQWGAGVEKAEAVTEPARPDGLVRMPGDTRPTGHPAVTAPIWRVDITPQMRAGVEAGQALFSAAKRSDRGGVGLGGRVGLATVVDAAAHEAATSPRNDLPDPTPAQREAGNYAKGHVRIAGHAISIENPAGSKRRPEWPALKDHYGYFKGTNAKDGDHVDVFVKPGTLEDYAGDVHVVRQIKVPADWKTNPSFKSQVSSSKTGASGKLETSNLKPETRPKGEFDEYKVMLGYPTAEEAKAAYLRNYEPGWPGLHKLTTHSQAEFQRIKDQVFTVPADRVPGVRVSDAALQASARPPVTHTFPDGYQLTGPGLHTLGSARKRAYHGTPHKVDKFSTSKIGTGEGAQAYGWGLYFAESEGVAANYQKELGGVQFEGKTVNPRGDYIAFRLATNLAPVLKRGKTGEEARKIVREMLAHQATTYQQSQPTLAGNAQKQLDLLDSIKTIGQGGNLYTVELLPDEDEFLDWDKPLSEQSEKVKAALGKFETDEYPFWKSDGGGFYQQLAREVGTSADASDELTALGIPGIRYLDGGSRGKTSTERFVIEEEAQARADQLRQQGWKTVSVTARGFEGDGASGAWYVEGQESGTSNYVIFDENLVRILEENGKPVENQVLASGAKRGQGAAMADPDKAAQSTEPSPGGLSEAEVDLFKKLGSKWGVTWKGRDYKQGNEVLATYMPTFLEAAKVVTNGHVSFEESADLAFNAISSLGLWNLTPTIGFQAAINQVKKVATARIESGLRSSLFDTKRMLIEREKKDVNAKLATFRDLQNYKLFNLKRARENGWPVDDVSPQFDGPGSMESAKTWLNDPRPDNEEIWDHISAKPWLKEGKKLIKVSGFTDLGQNFGDDPPDGDSMDGVHQKGSLFLELPESDKRNAFDLFEKYQKYKDTLESEIVGSTWITKEEGQSLKAKASALVESWQLSPPSVNPESSRAEGGTLGSAAKRGPVEKVASAVFSKAPVAVASGIAKAGAAGVEKAGLQQVLAKLGSNNLDKFISNVVFGKVAKWAHVDTAKKAVEVWLGKPGLLSRLAKGTLDQTVPLWNVPREWLAAYHESQRKAAWGREKAMDVIRALSHNAKVSDLAYPQEFVEDPAWRVKLFDAMEGKADMTTLPQPLQELAARLRKLLKETGQELVRQGIMSLDTFEELSATGWMPRYTEEEAEAAGGSWLKAFKLGVRDLDAQRSTAWHIVDTTRTEKDGYAIVSRDEAGKRNRWRFRNEQHRNAFYEDFIKREAVDMLTKGGKPVTDLLAALDNDATRAVREEIKNLTREKIDRPAELSQNLRNVVRRAVELQRFRYKKEAPFEPDKLIKDPVYSIARYVMGATHNAATMELLKQTAKNAEWVSDGALAGFTQIPDNDRFGPLSGKYVRDEIATQVLDLVQAPGTILGAYDAILRTWKAGKLVLNPGSHIRDAVGNVVFSVLSGSNPFNPGNLPFYRDAITALRDGGDTYAELIEMQVLGGDAFTTEVKTALKGLLPDTKTVEDKDAGWIMRQIMGVGATMRGGYEWAAAVRQIPDNLYKTAAYLKYKAQGMSPAEAAAEVRKWFPYYDRLGTSAVIKQGSRFVMPFSSFFRESTRILGRGAVERPLAMASILSFASGITALSLMMLGLGDEDEESVFRSMRGKLKLGLSGDRPVFAMLLPARTDEGQLQQWDLSSVLPFADLLGTRVEMRQGEDEWTKFWRSLFTQSPILSTAWAWSTNTDAFSGRKIVEEDMGALESTKERLREFGDTMLPPLTPWFGVHSNTIANAGRRMSSLDTRNATQSYLRAIVGLDVRSADPNLRTETEFFRKQKGLPLANDGSLYATPLRSRLGRQIKGELIQDAPDIDTVADAMVRLEESGNPIRSRDDMEKLLKGLDPDRLIKEEYRRKLVQSFSPEALRVWRSQQREFSAAQKRLPAVMKEASPLVKARREKFTKKP